MKRYSTCSWIGRMLLKCPYYPEAIYRFSVIPIKILKGILHRNRTNNPKKIIWNCKRPWIAKAIWGKKRKLEHHVSWFLTILQCNSNQSKMSIGIKTDRDQWNKIENPERNLHTYGQLMYNQRAKNRWWRKDSLFNK